MYDHEATHVTVVQPFPPVIVVHDNEKREWKTAGEDESKKKYGSPQPLPPWTPASSTARHIFYTGMRSQPSLLATRRRAYSIVRLSRQLVNHARKVSVILEKS